MEYLYYIFAVIFVYLLGLNYCSDKIIWSINDLFKDTVARPDSHFYLLIILCFVLICIETRSRGIKPLAIELQMSVADWTSCPGVRLWADNRSFLSDLNEFT